MTPCFLENLSLMCFFFTADEHLRKYRRRDYLSFHGQTKTNLTIRWSDLTGRVTEKHILILLPFGVKNHFKLWQAFPRELTVRTIQRLTLKSWYTNLQQKLLNRCQQVPEGFTDQSLLTYQTGNTIDWQALFTTSMDLLFTKNNSCTPCVPMFYLCLTLLGHRT